jgi:hypothetical protein
VSALANKPLCDLYFDCLRDFPEHSLSDSEPCVSYSVMGMWSVRIFLTSESVEPGLSDSRNWMSCESLSRRREPTRRTLVYSGSLLCVSERGREGSELIGKIQFSNANKRANKLTL